MCMMDSSTSSLNCGSHGSDQPCPIGTCSLRRSVQKSFEPCRPEEGCPDGADHKSSRAASCSVTSERSQALFGNRVQDQRIDGWIDHEANPSPKTNGLEGIAEGARPWPELTGFLINDVFCRVVLGRELCDIDIFDVIKGLENAIGGRERWHHFAPRLQPTDSTTPARTWWPQSWPTDRSSCPRRLSW